MRRGNRETKLLEGGSIIFESVSGNSVSSPSKRGITRA